MSVASIIHLLLGSVFLLPGLGSWDINTCNFNERFLNANDEYLQLHLRDTIEVLQKGLGRTMHYEKSEVTVIYDCFIYWAQVKTLQSFFYRKLFWRKSVKNCVT